MAKTIENKTKGIDVGLMVKLIKNFAKKNPNCLFKNRKAFSRYGSQVMYNSVIFSYRSSKNIEIVNMEEEDFKKAMKLSGYKGYST